MNCKLSNRDELIEKYLLNELNNSEMKSFEEHFLDCDECFAELQEMGNLTKFIKDEGDELFKEYATGKERDSPFSLIDYVKSFFVFEWSFKPALTYAFMAVFSGLIIINMFSTGSNRQEGSVIQSERLAELKHIYPDRFSISSDLENLVTQQYRAEELVIVKSPLNNTVYSGSIDFEWKGADELKLSLKILDNNEEVVVEVAEAPAKYNLDIKSESLKNGLYYWKLESRDNLLHVGKFYVDKSSKK